MIIWKMEILKELKKAGYNTTRLQHDKLLGSKTINDMKYGKMPGTKTLDIVCKLLKKQPGQLIAYIPDAEPQEEPKQDNNI